MCYQKTASLLIRRRQLQTTNMASPKTEEELRTLLGMVTFHSEFIQGFSVLTAPLFDALHKDVEFTWTEELELAWTRVKQGLCKVPALAAYQPTNQ